MIKTRKLTLVLVLAVLAAGCSEADLMGFGMEAVSFESGFESGSEDDALLNLMRTVGALILVTGSRLGYGF